MAEPSPEDTPFAWDGIALTPPKRWELAAQTLRKGLSSVAMEDETSRRLELEWTRPRTPPDQQKTRKRFDKLTRTVTDTATAFEQISGTPDHWSAFRYTMPARQTLVLAYYTPAQSGDPMCFLRLHFGAEARESPTPTLRAITESFRIQRDPLWQWRFYDVDFRLHRDFRLTGTSLQAGRKMLRFERGLRRLFVWHVSLADHILKSRRMEDWCAEFLNGFPAIRGPRFHPADTGIGWSRSRWRPFGHYEEIGRWCFRYGVGCRHLKGRNQIALWVYNCRRERDLGDFPSQFPLAGIPGTATAPDAKATAE